MDSSVYRDLMGQISKSCPIPHKHFPSHNLVSLETLLENMKSRDDTENNEESNNYLSDFPCFKPFEYDVKGTYAFYNGSGQADVAADFFNSKMNWDKHLKNIRIPNPKKAVKQLKKLKDGVPEVLAENVTNYIKHIQNDPEPEFCGNCNWLYSGGNLFFTESNDKYVLLTAEYSNPNSFAKPGFSALYLNETLDEIQFKSFCSLKTFSPILQIVSKCTDDYLFVFVRQKNYTSFFKFKADETLSFPEKLWRKKTDHPKLVTCVDINNSCTDVVVSDTNYSIHIFNIESKKKSYKCSLKKWKRKNVNREAWNQVIFRDYDMYVGLRNCFCFFDIRDSNLSPKINYCPSLELNSCEDIYSIALGPYDPRYVYLATAHSYLQIDKRNGKALQKWTHMMKDPPQFTTTTKDDDTDFMVLQSQNIEETLGITNKFTFKETFLSNSTPCILKGAKNSLKLARLNGLCLNPLLEKRVNYTVTGAQCQKNNRGDILYFTANSGGDIFMSKIKKKDRFEDENENKKKVLETMKQFETHVENFFPQHIDPNIVQTVNMTYILKRLKNKNAAKYKRPEYEMKFHRMLTGETSLYCKDLLAQKILKVWGVQEEEIETGDVEMTSEMKVRQWMEKID